MVHVIFDTNSIKIDDFIQYGGGGLSYFEGLEPFQRGRGYYVGIRRQRGSGVGEIFKGLWRLLLPALKSTGKIVKNEGLATGARILNNLSEGANLKDTLKNETITGVKNLVDKVQQKGSGKKRKAIKIGSIVRKNSINMAKKRKYDTFGFY